MHGLDDARHHRHKARYLELPAQDVTADLTRIPALPRSGVLITVAGYGPGDAGQLEG